MEVTAKNFNEVNLDTCLEECTFVSIDGEFTGLRSGREFSLNLFDTPEDRYRKHSAGTEGMFLLQVGLSFFKHLYMNEYEVSTFNFLISPKTPHFCVHDRYFTCQTSSLELLFKSGFSFDQCFKEGITYISQAEEAECRRSLELRAARRNAQKTDSNSLQSDDSGSRATNNKAPWWQTFEQNICKKLDETLLTGVSSLGLSDFTEEERSVLLRVIEKKYSDKFVLLSNSVNLLKEPGDWLKCHLADLDNSVGFASVVKKLSKSEKPIIGHNIYLDLIHLYRQFVGPLSESYEEAKSNLHKTFPRVLDTKLLANMDPLKDWLPSSALPELFKAVQKNPFKLPKVQNAAYGANSEDHLHQAGYDSYITGVVFIALSDKLCQLKEEKPGTIPIDSVSLHSYFNKVFMFRSWDYNFISLDQRDTNPNRNGVFHVTFPASFRTDNLLELFKSCGKVQIGWINDTSAYIGLQDADQANFAVKRLCSITSTLPAGVTVRQWSSLVSTVQKRKSTTEVDEMIVEVRSSSNNGEGDGGASNSNKKSKMSENSSETTDKEAMFSVPDQW